MLIGMAWAGTLVIPGTATPFPGADLALRHLPQTARTFVATTQDGPVLRTVTGEPGLPSVEAVAQQLAAGFQALGWRPDLLLISTWPGHGGRLWRLAAEVAAQGLVLQLASLGLPALVSPDARFRLPEPGMLLEARERLGHTGGPMQFIGSRPEEHIGAARANAPFVPAESWWRAPDQMTNLAWGAPTV
jgi:hypothetical protein